MYTRGMKYTITVPTNLMSKLDEYANEHNYNRSEAIREAIRRLCALKDDIRSNKPIVDDIVIPDFSKKAQARGL